ncbi:MAG: Bicyclomycin resistance protein [Syntrophorhabdus sp. PtaB.Bin047]|nr:MAG: Bicyclomycin resistance protein [Syntrophorhabdus sp. PtaB.Bin047]
MDPGQTLERKQPAALIIVLASIMAIGPFSTDMYLPAFLAIARGLATDIAHVGLSLTSYFIGVSVGQMIYGPLLDRFGRKRPLMLGLLAYTAASLGCAFSPTIHVLVMMRFLAGFGACVGIVGSRAVVRDLFSGTEMARMLSLLMMVFGIAPIIAPTIGSFVVSASGWQYIFVVLAAIGLLVFLAMGRFLHETKGHDASISLHPRDVVLEYVDVFRNKVFLTYGLVTAAATAGFFAYIAGSAFVYMGLLGFTETEFGFIYGGNVIGLVLSNQVNRILLRKHDIVKLLRTVTALQFLLIALLLTGSLTGFAGKAAILCLIFCYLFGFGCITSNAIALALEPFTKNAGTASALIGSLQMVAGALSSGLLSCLHNGTMIPMISMMTGCTCIGLLLIFGPGPVTNRAQRDL